MTALVPAPSSQGCKGDAGIRASGPRGPSRIRPPPSWLAHPLWARTAGTWRPAARVEGFGTRQWPDGDPGLEHGRAVTLALTWQPRPAWQVTGELAALRSVRGDRPLVGREPAQAEAQVQVAWRWYF